jgi:hypothetical protein
MDAWRWQLQCASLENPIYTHTAVGSRAFLNLHILFYCPYFLFYVHVYHDSSHKTGRSWESPLNCMSCELHLIIFTFEMLKFNTTTATICSKQKWLRSINLCMYKNRYALRACGKHDRIPGLWHCDFIIFPRSLRDF